MKRFWLYSITVVFSTLLFYSCDYVDDPVPEQTSTTSTTTTDTTVVKRKVLIEDFTGHKCPNCPEATRLIDKLQNTAPTKYGHSLIAVAIHAAINFSTPDGSGLYTRDFRTIPGTNIHNFFGASYYPSGMINRRIYNPTTKKHIKSHGSWATVVDSMINKPADVKVEIKNTYNSTSRQLTCEVTSTFLKAKSGNYKLLVYLTEDSIVSPQVDNKATPNDVTNYIHRHVLRAAINTNGLTAGVGDLLKSGSVAKDEKIVSTYNYTVPLNDPTNAALTYDDKHIYVVAFVYQDDPGSPVYKEILQVEEKKIQ